jgi:flagellar P-ring protein precursor FlgI
MAVIRTTPRDELLPALARTSILAVSLLAIGGYASPLAAQVPVRDLVIEEQSVPLRLMGYGLVVGLDNTGDYGYGGRSSQHTVQSVVNLLRRFDVAVPAELLRTRNVAAVLVTAEVSPYLRRGGKFEIQVSSVGDARSLRGGQLWTTPLVAEAGGAPVATAQGRLLVADYGGGRRRAYQVETSGRIPDGGLIEGEVPRPAFTSVSRLVLRDPDVGTAARIAAAIDTALGAGTAKVEDPGAIALTLPEGDGASQLARIRDLTVQVTPVARIVINAHDGSVAAGGELPVGPGVVTVGSVTLSIGGIAADTLAGGGAGGQLRVPTGTSVQRLATALQAVQTPPSQVALVFEALRRAGAISAEVVTR